MTRTFTINEITYEKNMNNDYHYKTENGKKSRISKAAFNTAYDEYLIWKMEQEEQSVVDEAVAEITEELQAEPKKAKKRSSKKHLTMINLEDGSQVGLTEKQILFIERMPESDFYEDGLNSTLWVDCYCDTLEGDLNAMQVGAMVSTLREKGLITVGSDRRNKKTVKYFALTGLGQMVAKALGLK